MASLSLQEVKMDQLFTKILSYLQQQSSLFWYPREGSIIEIVWKNLSKFCLPRFFL